MRPIILNIQNQDPSLNITKKAINRNAKVHALVVYVNIFFRPKILQSILIGGKMQ
jgi:hypothetical protein